MDLDGGNYSGSWDARPDFEFVHDHHHNISNSSRNCKEEQMRMSKTYTVRMVFVVAMILFSIAGFLGNLLIVLTIALVNSLRSTRNAFLANLALSDIVLVVIVVPFNIISVLEGRAFWDDGRANLCMFVASICTPGCLSAMWSVTGVSFNRYFFICRNESYERYFGGFRCVLWILVLWTLSFAIHLPNHIGWGHSGYAEHFFLCTRETKLASYSFFFSGVGIILPLTICFFSYLRIYSLVRTTTSARNKILRIGKRSNQVEVAVISQNYTTGADRTSQNINRFSIDSDTQMPIQVPTLKTHRKLQAEMRLIKTLFRSFAVFLVAWLPMAVLLMLPNIEFPTWVYLLIVFLAHGSTATNAVLYFTTNKEFRKGFRLTMFKLAKMYSPSQEDSSFTGGTGGGGGGVVGGEKRRSQQLRNFKISSAKNSMKDMSL